MIQVVEGKGVGSGKSYMVCEMLIHQFRQGGSAYASDSFRIKWDALKAFVLHRWGLHLEDDQFSSVSSEEIYQLHKSTRAGTDDCPVLIIVDEAQDQLNARDWADKNKRELFQWACQSRHDNNDLIFVSQSAQNIDKQIRRIATYTWSIRNLDTFPIPGLGRLGAVFRGAVRCVTFGLVKVHGVVFARTLLDWDGRTVLERKFVTADRGIFGCYESKSMRASRARLGQPIQKKNLKQDKTKMIYFRVLVPIAICALIFGIYWISKNGIIPGMRDKKPVTASSHKSEASPQTSPSGNERFSDSPNKALQTAYDIRTEVMLSTGPNWLKTKESGVLTVGEMSAHGMTEAVKDRMARVKTPAGRTLYVIGSDWTPPVRLPETPRERKNGEITVAPYENTPKETAKRGW